MRYTAKPVEVEAHVIREVGELAGAHYRRAIVCEDGFTLEADGGMLARMTPKPGDYVVIQADGYIYLNPKDVFERKYQPAERNALELGAMVRAAGLAGE